jgi:hypothetical protein
MQPCLSVTLLLPHHLAEYAFIFLHSRPSPHPLSRPAYRISCIAFFPNVCAVGVQAKKPLLVSGVTHTPSLGLNLQAADLKLLADILAL